MTDDDGDDVAADLAAAREAVNVVDRNALDTVDCRVLLDIEETLDGLERAYADDNDEEAGHDG